MKLTLKTDYALRTLLFLARRPQTLSSIAEVAEYHQISENHLIKVVHELGKSGYIETVRGKGGGIRIAERTWHVGLGELVRTMEDNWDIVECFKDPAPEHLCKLTDRCALQGIFAMALKVFMDELDRYKFSDLLHSTARSNPASTTINLEDVLSQIKGRKNHSRQTPKASVET